MLRRLTTDRNIWVVSKRNRESTGISRSRQFGIGGGAKKNDRNNWPKTIDSPVPVAWSLSPYCLSLHREFLSFRVTRTDPVGAILRQNSQSFWCCLFNRPL